LRRLRLAFREGKLRLKAEISNLAAIIERKILVYKHLLKHFSRGF